MDSWSTRRSGCQMRFLESRTCAGSRLRRAPSTPTPSWCVGLTTPSRCAAPTRPGWAVPRAEAPRCRWFRVSSSLPAMLTARSPRPTVSRQDGSPHGTRCTVHLVPRTCGASRQVSALAGFGEAVADSIGPQGFGPAACAVRTSARRSCQGVTSSPGSRARSRTDPLHGAPCAGCVRGFLGAVVASSPHLGGPRVASDGAAAVPRAPNPPPLGSCRGRGMPRSVAAHTTHRGSPELTAGASRAGVPASCTVRCTRAPFGGFSRTTCVAMAAQSAWFVLGGSSDLSVPPRGRWSARILRGAGWKGGQARSGIASARSDRVVGASCPAAIAALQEREAQESIERTQPATWLGEPRTPVWSKASRSGRSTQTAQRRGGTSRWRHHDGCIGGERSGGCGVGGNGPEDLGPEGLKPGEPQDRLRAATCSRVSGGEPSRW